MDRDLHDPRGALPPPSVLVLAILMMSTPAWGLGVGRPQAASSLGQPLNLLFPIQLNPGETVTPECVRAEVNAGENTLAASGLHWQVEGDGSRVTGVRLRSAQRIDEPIVSVQLSVGCPARLTRQYTAFIDPPGLNGEPVADPGPPPAVTVSPALQALQESQPPRPAETPNNRSPAPRAGNDLAIAAAATPGAADGSAERPRQRQRRAVEASPGTDGGRSGASRETRPAQGRTPTREARATRAPTPRLSLEPMEVLQAPAQALLAAEAAASAASAAEDARQQMLAMQKQLADMQAEQKRTLAAMTTLRQELQAAREQAANGGSASSVWVLGLSLLSLALAASSLLLWRSNRVQKREAGQHWLGDSRHDGEGAETVLPPVPTGPSPFTPTDPHSSPAPLMSHLSSDGPAASLAPSTIPMPLSLNEEPTRPAPLMSATPPAPPAPRMPARAPTTAADDALDALAALDALEPLSLQFERGDTRPAPLTADLGGGGVTVTVEELIDLEQQVDFFMVLGQDDAAIELLSSRLNHRDAASGLPFLKLMELYQRRGDRESFDRIGARFTEQFHARAPSWSDDLNEGDALETHAELMERLEAAWSDPEGSMSLLQDLLSNHQEYSGDLGLPAYRDLLLLYAVARDRAEHEIDGNSIDVVLPLDATAPTDQMATMVWQSPAPSRTPLTQSVDLDLSLVEDDETSRTPKGR
ncbi:type IV pilus assembly protein FimV [Roseateles chitinivorans]|uniref:type IV pilus assembly protein FimV n=1 Tax=Roseateles chitinivorans TaxID=2917965 RepID=UPI003D667C5C